MERRKKEKKKNKEVVVLRGKLVTKKSFDG